MVQLLRKCVLNACLSLHIHSACAVVENEDGGLHNQRACNRQPLLLPAGEVDAALFHARGVAIGQVLNEIVRLRGLRRSNYLGHVGVGATVGNVLAHAASKEHALLRHNGNVRQQRILLNVAHIHAIHQHAARRHVVEAGNEIDK